MSDPNTIQRPLVVIKSNDDRQSKTARSQGGRHTGLVTLVAATAGYTAAQGSPSSGRHHGDGDEVTPRTLFNHPAL